MPKAVSSFLALIALASTVLLQNSSGPIVRSCCRNATASSRVQAFGSVIYI
jgi:hypothetical protein